MTSRRIVLRLRPAALGLCAVALCAMPSLARACASCMNDDPIWQRKLPILIGFIGFPFLLFGVVFWAIRRHVAPGRRAVHASSLSKIQE